VGIGKLYRSSDEDFVVTVSYRLHDETPTNWWGELILMEWVHRPINEDAGYIIELDDKRKGRCYLKNIVDPTLREAVPCYIYHFTGASSLLTPVALSRM